MRRWHLLPVIAASLAVLVFPGRACACEPIAQLDHTVIASMQATDQTPPVLPALPPPMIHRPDGSTPGSCDGSTCRDVGIISIAALATDDMTAPARIGYRFTLESGTLPAGFTLPTVAIDGTRLWWGTDTGDEPIDFTLRVVAIDLAGNESAPQTVRVADDPGGACAVARPRRTAAGPAALVAAALLLAVRRRRRQPREPS